MTNYDNLPKWFKEKYKLELSATYEKDKYWVEMGDAVRLFEEGG